MAVFLFYKLWEKCYPKSYKCVIIQQGKKTLSSQSSFEHNGMDICDQSLESLEEKKGGAHFMQAWFRRICKPYTKGWTAGKLTWCEPTRDHLDYRWWDSIQRSSPKNTGRAKTPSTLGLEKFEYRHTLWELVHSDTSPLGTCQKS